MVVACVLLSACVSSPRDYRCLFHSTPAEIGQPRRSADQTNALSGAGQTGLLERPFKVDTFKIGHCLRFLFVWWAWLGLGPYDDIKTVTPGGRKKKKKNLWPDARLVCFEKWLWRGEMWRDTEGKRGRTLGLTRYLPLLYEFFSCLFCQFQN